jgi:asparagine synthase (glutamine-hydrolysing)
MCGIAGQFVISGGTIDRDLLVRMSGRLTHRGPDGEGSYFSGDAGLVHRRLAIIDLSPDAAQPMENEDGTLHLVFNGEIYNYIELTDELKRLGHTFRSRSDSEVILHAYEEWGCGCPGRLNGMWAFALLDEKKGVLFLSRDRLGIKPLYYAVAEGSLFFASEIKALLEHKEIGRLPDDEMVLEFLAWGAADHTSRTMFAGVSQILPGHSLAIGRNGDCSQIPYWDTTVNPSFFSGPGQDDTFARGLLDLLAGATSIHLRSDVPVGTCLSGGIDSSTLVVLINRIIAREPLAQISGRQKTFSACFDDKRFDESGYVDIVVRKTGVDSHCLSPDPGRFFPEAGHLLYMNDEPFAALTFYSQYCVMREASRHVKVVLDGQGADELFAGYLAYEASHIRGLLRSLHIGTALREMYGAVRHHYGFLSYATGQMFTRSSRRRSLKGKVPKGFRYSGSLDAVLYDDMRAKNLPYLLHWEDRTSMAFSIEARVPYLDYRVVEYVCALPQDQKIRNGVTKFVLRKAVAGLIPEAIRCRMDKKGFSTPEEVWMKENLAHEMLEIFRSASFKARPYWDADAILSGYRRFLEGKEEYSSEFWRFACAELWLRMFFDARRAENGIVPVVKRPE